MLIGDRSNLISLFSTQTYEKLNEFILVHHQAHGYPVQMTSLNDRSIIFLLLSDSSIYTIDLSILLHRSRLSAPEMSYRYVANVSLPTFQILALPTASGRK